MKDKRLLVISHTEHYLKNGVYKGWIPTIRELDFLASKFDRITHIAVLNPGEPPPSTTAYSSNNIKFVAIPPFGGSGLGQKMKIFQVIPNLLSLIRTELQNADLFQFRAPTSIGVFVIPYLTFFSKHVGWYKYAGNWVQPNMPISYAFQKWLLKKQSRFVTINGHWNDQEGHIHTFENPCLSKSELQKNRLAGEKKYFSKPYTGCFVGRLDNAKGVHRIVEFLQSSFAQRHFESFHFVGNGRMQSVYEEELKSSAVEVIFHGFQSRDFVFGVYAKSHLMFLPSDSEGFPKVIAEAASFGCVPIVSDVSSIGQYINRINGYLWPIGVVSFTEFMHELPIDRITVQKKSTEVFELAKKFTFEHYYEKLRKMLEEVC